MTSLREKPFPVPTPALTGFPSSTSWRCNSACLVTSPLPPGFASVFSDISKFSWILLSEKFHLEANSYFLLHTEQMKREILAYIHQLPPASEKSLCSTIGRRDTPPPRAASVSVQWENLEQVLSELVIIVSQFVPACIKHKAKFWSF